MRYTSINSHKYYELSRRDDIESIGYLLLYLSLYKLPWQGIIIKDEKVKNNLMIHKKENIVNDTTMPSFIIKIIKHAKSLKFDETPDYTRLKKIINLSSKSTQRDYNKYT